jgi:ribosomal protein S18 acetylase RimI-like enzyme
VALHGGEAVGFVMTSKSGSFTGLVVTIDILPEWRRRGIGARLMELAEHSLGRRGCRTVRLQVAVHNVPAMEFYDKMGYVGKRILRDYYGPGCDAHLFQKELVGMAEQQGEK